MFETKFVSSIAEIDPNTWNEIAGIDYPFTRHEFLNALEASQAVSEGSGWRPHHVLVFRDGTLVSVMPSYIKSHSYGEFVFDFEWANAYGRHGLEYYPKLVSAIPFTPATGQRICISPGEDKPAIYSEIFKSIQLHSSENGLSGWHILFPTEELSCEMNNIDIPIRKAIHFQWKNHEYSSFDAFLSTFSSRKRKNVRKERQSIVDQNIELCVFTGDSITDNIWDEFYTFYQMTYAIKSGHRGYLNKAFFQLIGSSMTDQIVLVMAKLEGEYIAGALNFKSSDCLFGRYWGASREFDNLHFEACYYQGIEYCIEKKLKRFDPGVQGEHKIKRGFEPSYTYSNHWISHPEFSNAIEHFLIEEASYVDSYKSESELLLPFKYD